MIETILLAVIVGLLVARIFIDALESRRRTRDIDKAVNDIGVWTDSASVVTHKRIDELKRELSAEIESLKLHPVVRVRDAETGRFATQAAGWAIDVETGKVEEHDQD